MRRWAWDGAGALAVLAGCTAALLPLRAELSPATDALVLVLPVLVGVATGGMWIGVGTALGGFLVYDWCFLPPYGTLSVGHAQDWVALLVYLVVVLVAARLVAFQQRARAMALAREDVTNRLLAVSEQLIADRPLRDLLAHVASTVQATFSPRWVAVLLPRDGALELASSAGDLETTDLDRLLQARGEPQRLTLAGGGAPVSRVALTALGRPVGQLVVAGAELDAFSRRALAAFANQAALAIERSQLRAAAVRADVLEEADEWRSALVGAVSHDLRTPLAAIKSAVGTLRELPAALSAADRDVLLETIETECDRLTRLVANVLDMARLETGALQPHLEPHVVADVVEQGLRAARWATGRHRLELEVAPSLPLVDVDLVLVGQVIGNLVTNAAQHAPEGSTITIAARKDGARVVIEVRDEGPGVPREERERIFHLLDRRAGSGRAGLGLAISSAFVEAHGGRLTVADAPGGGASFRFAVPVSVFERAAI